MMIAVRPKDKDADLFKPGVALLIATVIQLVLGSALHRTGAVVLGVILLVAGSACLVILLAVALYDMCTSPIQRTDEY